MMILAMILAGERVIGGTKMDRTMQHFISILDQMIENNQFFAFYFQSPFSLEDIEDMHWDYNIPRNISFYSGVSRGVISDSEWDEVIKFDLDSYYAEVSPCAAETTVYQAAVNARLDRCFTRARFIGTYVKTVKAYPVSLFEGCDDENLDLTEEDFIDKVKELGFDEGDMREVTIRLPLYAYEKANNVGWTCPEYEDEEGEIAHSYDSPLVERAEEVAASFVHEYGEELYAELSSFLREWDVNDLHCGNVGWIGKRFVLIDYAGYHE